MCDLTRLFRNVQLDVNGGYWNIAPCLKRHPDFPGHQPPLSGCKLKQRVVSMNSMRHHSSSAQELCLFHRTDGFGPSRRLDVTLLSSHHFRQHDTPWLAWLWMPWVSMDGGILYLFLGPWWRVRSASNETTPDPGASCCSPI